MPKASLISIAAYAPPKILTNFDLEKMVETSDEWIIKRTGIAQRRIAQDENTSELGTKAAKIALERANLTAKDIDAVICATISPDHLCMPSTACKIAKNLGIDAVTAFDISAACTGFIYLLELAKSLIEKAASKGVELILPVDTVVAKEFSNDAPSRVAENDIQPDWTDRATCILFGDGAGAAVVSGRESNEIIDVHTAADGNYANLLITPGGDERFIKMSGNEVFKIAVQTLTKDVVNILEKNRISSDKVDLFIPHQANLRIIEAVKQRLNFTNEQCVVTVGKYGNTSSASIPMAMNEAYEAGRLKKGDLILLDAFGGGFTWGSALLKFGGENYGK